MGRFAAVLGAAVALGVGWQGAVRGDVTALQKVFEGPPADARIMVRWWWFGPAVTKEGIERELKAMKAGGIGGVEVQPTYPLAVDGGSGDAAVKNLKFMSPEFLEMLSFTAGKCKELGMRMDLTLGSGWPYGGPEFSLEESAGAITTQSMQVWPGQESVRVNLRAGESVVAAFAGPAGSGVGAGGRVGRGGARGGGGGAGEDMTKFKEVPVENGAAQVGPGFAGGEVVFFVASHANGGGGNPVMQVKRPALGAEGNVMDHLSAKVVDKFIAEIAEKEIKACVAGGMAPHAIFCDSLEVNGENWTPEFLAEFQKRRGYDLKPYLPALVGSIGEKTEDVRYDFGRTVTEVFDDNFNGKLTKLAHQYGSLFRIQGYGSPPAGLLSYGLVDLPEGEAGGNGNWRTFRATRYAASASHLMGQKVASSETFTWLHQAPFRATPLDIKGEVDTHFLDGINQVICHGWPYTGSGASYPGWSFYAGGVFDDKNPWYVAMPEISGYMQRVSAMLREGTAANDVALYLPDDDVWARAGTGFSSMNAAYTGLNGMVAEIVDWGYNLDGWDDGMLAMKGKAQGGLLVFGEQKYKVVILAGAERMAVETARKLEEFVRGGGVLIAVGTVPDKAPGTKATAEEQKELAGIMQRLFKDAGAKGVLLPAANSAGFDAAFGKAMMGKLAPDVAIEPAAAGIGAVHRHIDDADVYFLANTGNQKQSIQATFRVQGMNAEWWDPLSGRVRALPVLEKGLAGEKVALEMEPLESGLVVWTKRALPMERKAAVEPVDLSGGGWQVTFADGPGGTGGGRGKKMQMEKLVSWTEVEGMRNYSGVASYEKKVNVSREMAAAECVLSLGSVSAAAPGGRGGVGGGQGYAAAVAPPVLDAAVVFVNGKRAGAAWCPPYRVEVTGLLKEGENTIRIDVGNTAMNYLQKAGFPNYDNAAVRAAFGNRFDPQGLPAYREVYPAGLTGPIVLEGK